MKKLKYLILMVAGLSFMLFAANNTVAQTNDTALPNNGVIMLPTNAPPGFNTTALGQIFNFLASNPDLIETKVWTFVPYVTRAEGLVNKKGEDAEWGAGIAGFYPLANNLATGVRAQWLGGDVFCPSMNVQLYTTKYLGTTKIELTPLAYTGVVMPMGGSSENGELGALYGLGLMLKKDLGDKWEVGGGYTVEWWSQLKIDHMEQFFFAFKYKF